MGDRPEDIINLNGKLYVLLQGAYYNDNRMAVFTAGSKDIKYVTVSTNSDKLLVYDNKIVIHYLDANYNGRWGYYDLAKNEFVNVGDYSSAFTVANGKLIVCSSVTQNWVDYTSDMAVYNFATNKKETFFKNVPEKLTNSCIYSISVNPYDNRVYVATSSFSQNGVIYVFDAEGNYERNFSACGINPHAIVFLN